MILARKIELNPSNRQRTLFRQHAGAARFAYNWGLQCCIDANAARKQERIATGETSTKFPSAIDLHKRLVADVKPERPWFYESSKCAPQQALRDLESAFKKMHTVPGSLFPRFKKKGGKCSFYLASPSGQIAVSGNLIRLPRIGWVRCKESVPGGVRIASVVISERAGHWFMAFKIEVQEIASNISQSVVGVDLGVSKLATVSTGETVSIPKQKKLQRKLIRVQRQHSRRQKGSGRRERSKRSIGAIHYRIANVRKDATHKLTTHLAKNHGVIVIEDLNVSGMMKNHCLAASIAAANFSEVRRQLDYKTKRFGSRLVVADRFFASSQICSGCGHRQKMPLHVRQYKCPACGLSLDRDLNAARNLAASLAVTARQNPEVTGESQCRDCCVKKPGLLIAGSS